MMNHERFWDLIEAACHSDPSSAQVWDQRLMAALIALPADEIIEWNHIFDQLAKSAYTIELWAAAYLINGGASDDGFYYFRCWLIGMGRAMYGKALADPDSLANVVSASWQAEGIDAEAEIYAAAHKAWMRVTGQSREAPYPARNEAATLIGEHWDFNSEELMQHHLPRLWAKLADQ